MRKIVFASVSAIALLGLAACNNNGGADKQTTQSTNPAPATSTTTPPAKNSTMTPKAPTTTTPATPPANGAKQ